MGYFMDKIVYTLADFLKGWGFFFFFFGILCLVTIDTHRHDSVDTDKK